MDGVIMACTLCPLAVMSRAAAAVAVSVWSVGGLDVIGCCVAATKLGGFETDGAR